ncbi:MAG: hypothetical protein P1V97_03970 [Planctomycetota bacterium]|nr:hypothetical protein [Planctomycetota bacterium]
MKQTLSILLTAALLLSSALPCLGKEPELAGRVYKRGILKKEFQDELRLLRIQVNPRFSSRDLWQRYAYLEKARQLGVRVSDEELIQKIGKLIRGHLVRIDAAKGIKGPLSIPKNQALYKNKMKELAKKFVFNKESLQRFLKLRNFDQAPFERVVRENLTIKNLLAQQAKLWPVKRRAQEAKRLLEGSCLVELLEWKADDHLLKLKVPEEVVLKGFYQENRIQFRRSRQLRLKYIERDDDGSLLVLAGLRKKWQALRAQKKTVNLDLWFDKEDFHSFGETQLGSWDELTLPPAFSSSDFQDILQRSKTGEVSLPLRFGGKQYLVLVLEQRRAQLLSYQALGGKSPEGELVRDWRRYQSLNNLYMKTHTARRELDGAAWSDRSLAPYKDKLTRLSPFGIRSLLNRAYPAEFQRRCLSMNTGESALIVDTAKRRILLIHIRQRIRPGIETMLVQKQDLDVAQKAEANQWRTQVFLESKGITKETQRFAQQLLAPRSKALVRTLKIPSAVSPKMLSELKTEFEQGAGLNLLALRAKVKTPNNQNVFIPSNFAKAAEYATPYKVEGPLIADGLLHLMMTEPMVGRPGSKIARRRVFHMAFRTNSNVKAISDQASALKYQLDQIADPGKRLELFRLYAAQQSEAPTAKIGGYIGQIQIDQDSFETSCRRQVALLKAGERCQFGAGKAHVFLAILNSEPIQKADIQSFQQLMERAYPWSGWNRK